VLRAARRSSLRLEFQLLLQMGEPNDCERRHAPGGQNTPTIWGKRHRQTLNYNMEKSKTIEVAAAFILGSLAGAGIALIVAPQSGKRTREDLRYWGNVIRIKSKKAQLELEHGMKTLVADVSEKLEHAVDEGRHFTDKTVPALLDALESGTRSIKAEIDKVMHSRVA